MADRGDRSWRMPPKATADPTGRRAAIAGTGADGMPAAVQPATTESPEGGFLRWFPGLKALHEYQRAWLRRDIAAGLVLTAVLVPVGMAYAEAAGLPPITGLYATIVPLIAYAIFGPSRILVLGPDSSLAGIIAAVVLPLAAGDPARAVALAGMLSIITGIICVAAGVLKFGFITDLLSKPVRYGYVNGIALTVIVGQLPKLFGFSIDASGLIDETRAFVRGLRDGETNVTALLIGAASLAAILGCKRWLPKVPGVLVAVVGATAIVGAFGLAEAPSSPLSASFRRGCRPSRSRPSRHLTSVRSWPERSASRSSPLPTRACSLAPLPCEVVTRWTQTRNWSRWARPTPRRVSSRGSRSAAAPRGPRWRRRQARRHR